MSGEDNAENRKYGLILQEREKLKIKLNGELFSQDCEKSLHPDDGRRLVGVLAKTQPKKEYFWKKVEPNIDYVAYPDQAIDAVLTMGATAQSHMSSLSSQRLAMTTVNLGLVTAVVAYLAKEKPDQLVTLFSQQTEFLFSSSLVLGALFGFIAWSIGSAETYYYRIMIGAQHMASRHYNLMPLIREAQKNYRTSMVFGLFSFFLGQHTYKSFVFINFLLPIAGFYALWFLSGDHSSLQGPLPIAGSIPGS